MYGKLYSEASSHKQWNDKPCERRLSGFVCQRPIRSSETGKPSGAKTQEMPCRGYASQSQCKVDEASSSFGSNSQSPSGGREDRHLSAHARPSGKWWRTLLWPLAAITAFTIEPSAFPSLVILGWPVLVVKRVR